jgi:hypothetical protein
MTDATTSVVRLEDLAEPRFSEGAQQILDMMAAMAPECALDADALHAKASADTGLNDFGPDDYRERLDVYLAALREIGGYTRQEWSTSMGNCCSCSRTGCCWPTC